MAGETSAGVLAWRPGAAGPEVLLVHPGGPYWAKKDAAAWSIPKGLVEPGEDPWSAARREFAEELGQPLVGEPQALTPCGTPGGKLIVAFLVRTDFDAAVVASGLFEMEWPPHSGRRGRFPEVDRACWFDAATAALKIHKGQRPILSEALSRLKT